MDELPGSVLTLAFWQLGFGINRQPLAAVLPKSVRSVGVSGLDVADSFHAVWDRAPVFAVVQPVAEARSVLNDGCVERRS
jgi:hypothetical protein